MSNYTKTTDFEAKDSLPTGDSGKIIRGAEFETEFDAISTAIATKADTAGPTFTGTATFATISDGTIAVTAFVDEDDMSSDSATLVPTQQSVKAYVDSVTTELQAQDLDFQADSGGALTIDLDTETMTFTGGVGIDTTGSGNDVSFAIDSTVTTLTGTQTLTNKTLTSPDVNTPDIDGGTIDGTVIGGTTPAAVSATTVSATGNITVDGTVDGRDIAADGTKLDTVETNADVTDTANVTAAGALMDSEVTNLDQVKAFDSADYATAAQGTTADNALPKTGGAMTGAITTNSTFDGRDVATDGTKLDGIEASADVTDTTNVTAAGALMDSELTDLTAVKSLDQGVATTDTPTFAGLATSADVSFGDNDKAIFGAGSDLQIYHDGSASYIKDLGTGPLAINTNGSEIMLTGQSGSEYMVRAIQDGAVELFYDANKKLATTATGIDVTGTATMDGLTVDGDASVAGTIGVTADNGTITTGKDSASSRTHWSMNNPNGEVAKWDSNGTDLLHFITDEYKVYTAGNKAFEIDGNGDISFYEDTGTTPKLFWDASAESLGIGTSLPQKPLHINSGTGNIGVRVESSDATASIEFMDNGTTSTALSPRVGGISDDFFVQTNGTEAMRIDSSGNVGIACTPDTALNAFGYKVLEVAGANTTKSGALLLSNSSGTNFGQIYADNSDGWKFVNGQATKSTIFYGGSGAAERMRLDASGNLLVGKTNTTFSVTGIENRADGRITSTRSGNTNLVLNRLSSDGSLIDFYKDGATVGSIGTDTSRFKVKSNSLALYLENESNKQLVWGNVSGVPYFYPQSDNDTNIGYPTQRFKDLYLSGTANAGNMQVSNGGKYIFGGENTRITGETDGSGKISLFTGGTEKVTLSGGNLLVSKTSNDNSTAGVVLRDTGEGSFVASGQRSGLFNRLSSDGEIINFRKDGTTVGSIKADAGSVGIGSGDCGLLFYDAGNRIIPRNGTSTSDASLDLGATTDRFKDLYLSGGVYLGGTGSANKLDDYEEGTWTPTLVTGGWTLDGLVRASYTKIGNTVHVRCYTGVSGTGNSAALVLGGLPFTANTNSFSTGIANLQKSLYAGTYARVEATTTTIGFYASAESTSTNLIEIQGTDIGSGYIIFSVTYETT